MKSYLENKEKNQFWEIVYLREEGKLINRYGEIGFEGAAEEIDDDEATELYGAPGVVIFDFLVKLKVKEGFVVVIDPVDLRRQLETAQEVKLKGRILDFYESGEVLKFQNRYHKKFDCLVNFNSRYATGIPGQSYPGNLIPLAGEVSEKGYEDEQRWIGINPDEPDSPVYELLTSSFFEQVYNSFDEFLADFE
jgi:hypothetical protein